MNNEQKAELIGKLARYYHSPYVKLNRPEVLAVPFKEWLERQLLRLGGDPN